MTFRPVQAGVEAPQDRPGGAADLRRLREHDVGRGVVVDRPQVLVPLEAERPALEADLLDRPRGQGSVSERVVGLASSRARRRR